MKTMGFIGAVVLVLALSGCGSGGTKPAANGSGAGTTKSTSTAKLPDGLLLKEAPADAKEIAAAKKDVKEGDEVIIRGRIAGSEEPFTPQRAQFQLADTKLLSCNERPDDPCKTPWDLCCDAPETIRAHSATIQIVDEAGKPLKMDVKGASGIDYLTVMVVKGKVARREADNLVVNATGIYIEPSKKGN